MANEIVGPQFPRWVYSAKAPKGQLVETELELAALEGQWYSSPTMLEEHLIGSVGAQPKTEDVGAADPVQDKADTAQDKADKAQAKADASPKSKTLQGSADKAQDTADDLQDAADAGKKE